MPDGPGERDGALDYERARRRRRPGFEFPDLDENARRGHVLHERHHRPPQGRRLLAPLDRPAHAVACTADAIGVREADSVLPVVPMFHANAWGMPYAARWRAPAWCCPGPKMPPADLAELIVDEQVTCAAGVPTIWQGVLQLDPHARPLLAARDPVRRLGRARGADPRLRRALRRADRAGLGHDRDQPARLGRRACPATSR